MTGALRDPPWIDALLGCAVGDCLGVPWENAGTPPETWPATSFEYENTCWTDDTQQSLVLLDVWMRDGRLDPDVVMQRFVAMRDDAGGDRFGLHRGTGRGFRHAVDRYASTRRFEPMPGRAGNGAAMRVAPVAYAMGRSNSAREQIIAVSCATHGAEVSIHAAIAVAEMAWALCDGLRGRPALREVAGRLPPGAARTGLEAAASSREPVVALEEATGKAAGDGHALGSPLAAVILAACAPSVHAALRDAVMLGGDTDSTAAMTGALRAGADGLEGLPPALLEFPMADRLRRWSSGPPPLEEWLQLERDLCRLRAEG